MQNAKYTPQNISKNVFHWIHSVGIFFELFCGVHLGIQDAIENT